MFKLNSHHRYGKVSAALAGSVHFQPLGDGRLVVRYSVPDVGAGQASVTAG